MNQRSKIIAIVIGIVVVLLGAATFLFARGGGGQPISTYQELPTDFTTAVRYGDSSILFTNNRALVSYDYQSGKSALLSAEDDVNGLTGIDSLAASDDGRYILFHQEQVVAGSQLAAALTRAQLSTTSDYWWVYDTTGRIFTPLPSQTILAKFDGGSLLALTSGSSGENITTYSLPAVTATKGINIPGSTNFWAYNGGYLLQLANGNLSYTENGAVSQTYFKDTTLIGVVDGTDKALGTTTSGDTHQAVTLDLQNQSSKVLASDVTGTPLLDPHGYGLYVVSQASANGTTNTFYTYDFDTGKSTAWSLTGTATAASNKDDIQTDVLLGNKAVLGGFEAGVPFILGEGIAPVNTLSGDYSQNITVQGDPTNTVSFDSTTRGLTVTSPLNGIAAARQAAEAQLTHDGADPNLFPIDYELPDGD